MDTKSYTYAELSKYTNMYTGGLSFDLKSVPAVDDCNRYQIVFEVHGKALTDKVPYLFKLLRALALETELTDVKHFQELLNAELTDWDNNFFSRGQEVAKTRLASYFSTAARIDEADSLSYYRFLQGLAGNFAQRQEETREKLRQLLGVLFNRSRFLVTYSCEGSEQEQIKKQLLEFLQSLPASRVAGRQLQAPLVLGRNEGIETSGKVQYVTAGGDFRAHGQEYTGAMQVLATMLRYEYLWTKIRIQGGAYGANAAFSRDGVMIFSTYRDPQLKASLDAFKQLPDWLAHLQLGERELTKYVIGTISGLDTPLTNYLKTRRVALQELAGLTPEMRQKTRNEILDVQLEDLQALAEPIRKVLQDDFLCVVGGQQTIEAAGNIFKKTFPI